MNHLPIHGLIGMPRHIKIIVDSDYDTNDSSTSYASPNEDSKPFNDLNEDMNSDHSELGSFKITSPIRKLTFQKRKYQKVGHAKGFNNGKWKTEEHEKYLYFREAFLLDNPSWTEIDKSKKRSGYFVKMSEEIGTRTPQQCRSHDQKFRRKEETEQELSKIRQNLQEARKRSGLEIKLEEMISNDTLTVNPMMDLMTSFKPRTHLNLTDTSSEVSDNGSIDGYFNFSSDKIIKVKSEDRTRSMTLIPGVENNEFHELLITHLPGKTSEELDTKAIRKALIELVRKAGSLVSLNSE